MGKFGEYSVLVMQLLALIGVGIGFILLSGQNLNAIWPQQVGPELLSSLSFSTRWDSRV